MENTNTLTVADMASLRALIDTAVSRGAYRGSELRAVGEIYERLDRFVEHTQSSLLSQVNNQPVAEPPQGEQNA